MHDYEVPREFTLTLEPFSVENGLLTPTMKLKRKAAQEYFKKEIQDMYTNG